MELKNSQPSGSSVAIEPTSASCTSGISSLTSRYASITPIGSFQGSKRDTWHSSGRSTSMPNWSHTKAASSGESAMFFGDSGSIAGGQMCTPPPRRPGPPGTYCWRCQTDASYSRTSGTMWSIASGFGVERSMWQRHTHVFAFSGTCRRIAGRLRVVDDDHVPAARDLGARSARCSGRRSPTPRRVSESGFPWSALCMRLVTL